jgi:UDP-N-acetylglucosamine 2-epimerase (non-hydrolysing)
MIGVIPGAARSGSDHRPENVDDRETLKTVLEELGALPLPVVLPIHPRTADRARTFGLAEQLSRIIVTEPLRYTELIALAAEAAVLLTRPITASTTSGHCKVPLT